MSKGPAVAVVRCPAKVNLFLEVVRRRPDGFHDIDTVIQAISLYDELRVEATEEPGLLLECSDPTLPTDGRNLVMRAAVALRERMGHRGGARMSLTKRIPQQAGLGGGSSDAAAALVGLNAAWALGLSREELRDVAAGVGSDVAFFLYGGTARCTGRGEVVEPLEAGGTLRFVLLCPRVGISTAAAYGRLRRPLTSPPASASMLVSSLAKGHEEGVARGLFNRLEEPAFELHPALREVKARLCECGALLGVSMTGSGSAFFGLCRAKDQESALAAARTLGLGEVLAVEGIRHGVEAQAGTGAV